MRRRGFLTALAATLTAMSFPRAAAAPAPPPKPAPAPPREYHPVDITLTAYVRQQLRRPYLVRRWGWTAADGMRGQMAVLPGEVLEVEALALDGRLMVLRQYISGVQLRDAYDVDGLRRAAALYTAQTVERAIPAHLRGERL